MSKRSTPQREENQRLHASVAKAYGENAKSSRKNIPLRKAGINRRYRHAERQAFHLAVRTLEFEVPKRLRWRKHRDVSLASELECRESLLPVPSIRDRLRNSRLRDEAVRRLKGSGRYDAS